MLSRNRLTNPTDRIVEMYSSNREELEEASSKNTKI